MTKLKKIDQENSISEVDSLYNSNLFKLQIDELIGNECPEPESLKTELDKLILDIKKSAPIPSTSVEKLVEKYKSGLVLLPIPLTVFNQRHLFECGVIRDAAFYSELNNRITCDNPITIRFTLPFKSNNREIKKRLFNIKRAIVLCNLVETLIFNGHNVSFTYINNIYFPYIKVKNINSKYVFIIKPLIDLDTFNLNTNNLDTFNPYTNKNCKFNTNNIIKNDILNTKINKNNIFNSDKITNDIINSDKITNDIINNNIILHNFLDNFLPNKTNLKINKDLINLKYLETPFFNQCILNEIDFNIFNNNINDLNNINKLNNNEIYVKNNEIERNMCKKIGLVEVGLSLIGLNERFYSFSDGLTKVARLLRHYLKNRPFGNVRGGVHDRHIFSILSYLNFKNLIYDHMNPCQIIRVFFSFISTFLNFNDFSFYEGVDAKERILLFKKYFNIVLLDRTGYKNLLFDISKNNFDLFVYDAKISFASLNTNSVYSIFTFSNIFLTNLKFNNYFDMIFSVNFDVNNDLNNIWFKEYDNKLYSRCLIDTQYSLNEASLICLRKLIKRVLKNRYILCCFNYDYNLDWDVNKINVNNLSKIKFGLILKFPECCGLSIVGPMANHKDAIDFRKLYGELCKVFKFNDGSVNEVACISPNNNLSPTESLLRYIFKFHCYINSEDLYFIFSQFDLLFKNNLIKNIYTNFQSIEIAFNEIYSKLNSKEFDDFKIKNVIKCDPLFSKTSINSTNFCDSINHFKILIEVNIKSNMNPQISESVLKIYKFKVTLMIFKNLKSRKVRVFLYPDYIEVRYKNFSFELHVYFTNYLKVLYNNSLKNPDLNVTYLKNALEYHYIPGHLEFIQNYSEKYPSFSDTVKLLKLWVSSQMLIQYIPEQILEIIVAYVYENPFPYEVPRHHFYGFLRALKVIGYFDWNDEILIVGSGITDGDIQELNDKFKKHRDSLPSIVVFTPYDKNGCVWIDSKNQLLNVMIKRFVKIARVSYELLEDYYPSIETDTKIQMIFKPNLFDFPIVIELIISSSITHQDYINFYKNLQIHFNDYISWLMDIASPKYICGVFKANTGEMNFNVSNCQHRKPVQFSLTESIKGKCKIDVDRVIEDIRLIGKGLCDDVKIRI